MENVFEYNMKHEERGIALIINNKKFKHFHDRKGTDVDKSNMNALFAALNFERIEIHDDLKGKEIEDTLKAVAEENHKERDCFVCVILSYGGDGYVYGTDQEIISMDDLMCPFKGNNCQSLAGKPKLFFIQACSPGKTVADAKGEDSDEGCVPAEADFLMTYSIVPGDDVWGKSGRGSLFIDAIQDVFQEQSDKLDVFTMMTKVNKKVSDYFEKNASAGASCVKQIPCTTSKLTKDIFF